MTPYVSASADSSSGKAYVTGSSPRLRRMKTLCMPASNGPGRMSALDATRSSKRSHRMLRRRSVASADSNWKTPAEHPVRLGVLERQLRRVELLARPFGDHGQRIVNHRECR